MSPHRVKDYVFYSEEWLEVRYEHYNISYFKPDLISVSDTICSLDVSYTSGQIVVQLSSWQDWGRTREFCLGLRKGEGLIDIWVKQTDCNYDNQRDILYQNNLHRSLHLEHTNTNPLLELPPTITDPHPNCCCQFNMFYGTKTKLVWERNWGDRGEVLYRN